MNMINDIIVIIIMGVHKGGFSKGGFSNGWGTRQSPNRPFTKPPLCELPKGDGVGCQVRQEGDDEGREVREVGLLHGRRELRLRGPDRMKQ